MSRPVDSGGSKQHDAGTADDTRRGSRGEADQHRAEGDSKQRHSHPRKEESRSDRHRHHEREERRVSDKDSGKGGETIRDVDTDKDSHRHRDRPKRTRDGNDSSEDSSDEKRERKHKKHKRHKKDKKHKHRDRHHGSELDHRIQQTKQQLALLASPNPTASPSASSSPAVLTSDDYFARSAEFRLWLHNSRSLHLDELESDKARKLFDNFCSEWNDGRLPAVYYKGVDSSALSGDVLTRHKWGFVGAMSETDKLANASVRDSVDTATHHHTYQQEFTPTPTTSTTASTGPSAAAAAPAASTNSSSSSSRHFNAMSRGEKRSHVQRVEALMDEVAPRETGREAMLLKRREKSEYSRRERGGDGVEEIDDDVLMGGGGGQSELARLKERESQRREKRNLQLDAKRSEWDKREKERMRSLLQSIGQADKYNI